MEIMNQQKTRVILVRHGRSTYNDRGLFQGCCDDSLLSENGKLQADRTGLALQNIKIDAIYSSPLQRTQQTAKEICNVINYPRIIHTHPYLKEIDLPVWEGLSFTEVRENLAEDYRLWQEFPDRFQMVSFSNTNKLEYPVLNLYDRAAQFWQEILPNNRGKNILIVSHGGTIRALISTALGIKPSYYHYLQQSNCGISILELDSENSQISRLKTMNLTSHLGETLPKLKAGKQGARLILFSVDLIKSETIQTLTNLLEQIPLDFYFYQDCSSIRSIITSLQIDSIPLPDSPTNSLLTDYPKILSLTQTIPLSTALIIANSASIQSTLVEILGKSIDPTSFSLQPNTMTIIHYPTSTNHPIIQAINFSESTMRKLSYNFHE
jgi:probable phosphoglycerate mutase